MPGNRCCSMWQSLICLWPKVLCVHADKKYMDENGTFSFEKAKPIVYSHGWYYGLGKKIGKFGYSVIKKKAAKKRYRKNK